MTPADLRALADRVEAGAKLTLSDLRVTVRPLLPAEVATQSVVDAVGGSIDACAALHKAVLGERWDWVVMRDFFGSGRAILRDEMTAEYRRPPEVLVDAPTPARAWLAAILRARAADMEGEG